MREHLRRYGMAWLLVAIAFVAPVLVYSRLPEVVPTHWNAQGVVDNLEPRFKGVFMLPLVAALVTLAMISGEWFAPRGPERPIALRYWPMLVSLTASIMLYLVIVQLRAALGHAVDVQGHVLGIVGASLAVSGNYMGKLTRNRVFGIRTPWTLASDHVWERTHRLGGLLFVGAGFALVVSAFLPGHGAWFPWLVLAAILVVPLAYSWWLARAEERGRVP